MISTEIATRPTIKIPVPVMGRRLNARERGRTFRSMRLVWLCIILACAGMSWFVYQSFLVPQAATFAPPWGGAQWIQAADNTGPVAYFRYTTTLDSTPDGAFVTVAASQVFRLYVNGTFVGTNAKNFVVGDASRAYLFDVNSLLASGPNVIALRVSNLDTRPPLVRAALGIDEGQTIVSHGTGAGWLATTQSTLVYARNATRLDTANGWAGTNFDASAWQPVRYASDSTPEPMLTVNPALYARPANAQWVSAGSGHDGFFVRQFSAPLLYTGAWLRLAASGTADVFLNGHLLIRWNGQIIIPEQHIEDYLGDSDTNPHYRSGLAMGVYNIAPYIVAGTNTIAVHVLSAGTVAAQVGLDALNAAMSADVLITGAQGDATWLTTPGGWHTSPHFVSGWQSGSLASLSWPLALAVGRPGALRSFYLQDSATPRNQQFLSLTLIAGDIGLSIALICVLWLLTGLLFLRRYYRSHRAVLEAASLIFLPALALESVLIALSREPLFPQPFPYTWRWCLVLLCMIGVGMMLVWRGAAGTLSLMNIPDQLRECHSERSEESRSPTEILRCAQNDRRLPVLSRNIHQDCVSVLRRFLRNHWMLLVIFLLALPFILYGLTYEPYWQDELTSYFAARGILAHGLPIMPSGFLYPKGELYSYALAVSMFVFGDQGGAPRILSIIEYLVSIPLFYTIACSFFNRRVATLAAAMLAFSPVTLLWGREVRMYEQAQLCTLLVVYLFYRALDAHSSIAPVRRKRFIYLAMLSVVLTYLSHEETFIIFPSLIGCALLVWYTRRKSAGQPFSIKRYGIGDGMGKHWLVATLMAASCIGGQLLVVHFSHPPVLGTDQSQRPLILFTTDNVMYYVNLLFFPPALGQGTLPFITLDSILAVAGCVLAARGRHLAARYCAVFLSLSFLTLIFAFTLASDRYIYPVLPLYYLLGAYALFELVRRLRHAMYSRLAMRRDAIDRVRLCRTSLRTDAINRVLTASPPVSSGSMETSLKASTLYQAPALSARLMLASVVIPLCAVTLVLPVLPVSNYNLALSRAVGLNYHRHYADYDAVGTYMHQHWKAGDTVITVSPAISILYYVGHVDYFFSLDRALYLFERNGHIIDTPTGSIALLDQQDFLSVIAAHSRVWIISDNGLYQAEAIKRFVFPPDFQLVYEGYGSAIYFRNG